MKLIIDMPEEVREYIFDLANDGNEIPLGINAHMVKAIVNGIPLPKGHGRLIDADAFERRCMFDSSIEDMQDVIYALRDYKPIIEADKESEDEADN